VNRSLALSPRQARKRALSGENGPPSATVVISGDDRGERERGRRARRCPRTLAQKHEAPRDHLGASVKL